jgi:hypothetical protein
MISLKDIARRAFEEWEATKQPIKQRGVFADNSLGDLPDNPLFALPMSLASIPRLVNAVAPIGIYDDGSEGGRYGPAVPAIVDQVRQGLKNFGRYGYDDDAVDDNARHAFDIAGGAATGGLAAGVKMAPKNALMSNGIGRAAEGQAARHIDDLGYYSGALEAARNLPQNKGTPEQMLAMLRKSGAKQGEVEAMGLGEFLAGREAVTKDDLVGFLSERRLVPQETTYAPASQLNDAGQTLPRAMFQAHSLDKNNPTYRETTLSLPPREGEQALSKGGHFEEDNIFGHMMTSKTSHMGKPVYTIDQIQSDWGQAYRKKGNQRVDDLEDRQRQLLETDRVLSQEADELYEKLSPYWDPAHQPRGDHYRGRSDESLIYNLQSRLDDQKDKGWLGRAWDSVTGKDDLSYGEDLGRYRAVSDERRRLLGELRSLEGAVGAHPLINTTNQWVSSTLRRALTQAVNDGDDYMAIPSGKTVLSYNPGQEAGMSGFYDDIVPNNLEKILRGIDPAIQKDTIRTLATQSNHAVGDGFSMFPITDVVREHVRQNGLPLFSNPKTAASVPLAMNALEQQAPKGIRAYHGSPHDFDKFSLDRIGTGEGAQAYGHGLYFADSEDVARSYRDALTQYDMSQEAADVLRAAGMSEDDVHSAGKHLLNAKNGYSPNDAAKWWARSRNQEVTPELIKAFTDANRVYKSPGRMYEVNIKANPEDFLDWDKPLSQQNKSVQDALMPVRDFSARTYNNPDSMRSLLRSLVAKRTGFEPAMDELGASASSVLREAGIPGIRYLDGMSRSAGEGSSNYVVFDDELIDILRKYSNAPTAAPLGMLPSQDDDMSDDDLVASLLARYAR